MFRRLLRARASIQIGLGQIEIGARNAHRCFQAGRLLGLYRPVDTRHDLALLDPVTGINIDVGDPSAFADHADRNFASCR
mgnify:CR=1 FL=1